MGQGWKGHTKLQSHITRWRGQSQLGKRTPARDNGERDLAVGPGGGRRGFAERLASLGHTQDLELVKESERLGTDPKGLLTLIFLCFLFLYRQEEPQNLGKG